LRADPALASGVWMLDEIRTRLSQHKQIARLERNQRRRARRRGEVVAPLEPGASLGLLTRAKVRSLHQQQERARAVAQGAPDYEARLKRLQVDRLSHMPSFAKRAAVGGVEMLYALTYRYVRSPGGSPKQARVMPGAAAFGHSAFSDRAASPQGLRRLDDVAPTTRRRLCPSHARSPCRSGASRRRAPKRRPSSRRTARAYRRVEADPRQARARPRRAGAVAQRHNPPARPAGADVGLARPRAAAPVSGAWVSRQGRSCRRAAARPASR
jgi:hypothetical protein